MRKICWKECWYSMNSRVTLWFIVFLIIGGLFFNVPKLAFNLAIPKTSFNLNDYLGRFPIHLGLDLQGGTQMVLQTVMDKIPPENRDQALESARQVIERRVN